MTSYILAQLEFMKRRSFIVMLLVAASVAMPGWGESPTINISPSLAVVPAKQGGRGTDVFKITTGGSFTGTVNLQVSGLPSSISAWWSSSSVAVKGGTGYSTLTVAPSAGTSVNWYGFKVFASGDGKTVERDYAVQVRPTAAMQIELSSPALTLWHGGNTNLSVTAVPLHGVTLDHPSVKLLSRLPAEVSAAWSGPRYSDGKVTWNLHLASNSDVEAGNYPIQMSAQITDPLSGLVYTATQQFPLLVSLVASATVDLNGESGPTIPASFMGLSHEWWEPIYLMGENATGTNPIYRQLLENLTAYGAGPINIRIGGESTDSSGMPGATTLPPMADLAKALGAKFDLSVNLGDDDVSLAVNQAKAYISQMPSGSIAAIEIGNEPDLYYRNGKRWSGYTVDDYFSDFTKWKNGIMPVLPEGVKLMGPSWASTGMLLGDNLTTFLSENSRDVSILSQHNGFVSPSSHPPSNVLLLPIAATGGPSGVPSSVSKTHADGIPFRMGEIGSADDGGIDGISNAFAAALWEVDTMFEYAKVGVDGVNWSASINDYNTPFSFSTSTSKGYTHFYLKSVNPTYYGMLFFQAATGNRAKILPVTLAAQANVKAWATKDASGTPRVVIINKDEQFQGGVSVTVPGYNHASVLRLTAPSYKSTSGVRFAGQTFDGSSNGKIQGERSVETIDGKNGVFEIGMGITSAALLIFSY